MSLDYFRYYTRWNDHANRRAYAAPADPWAPIRVDPGDVERFNVASLRWGLGRVRGGDWDRPEHCRRVEDIAFHEACHQHFEQGRPWAETAYADWAADRFEQQDRVKGYESAAAFLEGYGAELDAIYEDMRTNGYRPNRGRLHETPADAERIHDLEPIVLVGRDGEIIWTEGFHRLILADLAGVDSMPVYVLRRHADWQAIRDATAEGPDGEPSSPLDGHGSHPDLQDLLGASPPGDGW